MTHIEFTNAEAAAIVAFLRGIGIGVRVESLPAKSFLPGLMVREGSLVVDPSRLDWPGDLLHEAGHIAVTAPELRGALCDVADDAGDEMAAIAWSWAAAMAIGIRPEVLFHEGGYRGGSKAFIENFSAGRFLGVPMLQYCGMSVEPHRARSEGLPPFPHMLKWLR
jgi:hypothetical protein